MPNAAMNDFACWLTERCEFLHSLETEAERVLHEDKDTEKYRALMCQKAMFLQALPVEAEKVAAPLPASMAGPFLQQLAQFSENASRALGLDSVFYMYALLYPDNHVKGEPNNLDLLAERARALAAE